MRVSPPAVFDSNSQSIAKNGPSGPFLFSKGIAFDELIDQGHVHLKAGAHRGGDSHVLHIGALGRGRLQAVHGFDESLEVAKDLFGTEGNLAEGGVEHASLVDLEVDTPGLEFLNGSGDVEGHSAGLGSGHQTAGAELTTDLAVEGHDIGSGDGGVEFQPAFLDLRAELFRTGDVGAGSASFGFLFALTTGAKFIESGSCKKVVVVGADKMSSIVDYTDRSTCPIFGDGAAAVLLEPNEEGYGVLDEILRSDGSGEMQLYMKAGGSRYPASVETVQINWHTILWDGHAVFKAAVAMMSDVSVEMMERHNLKGEDIRFLVPHQANLRIIDATARRMGITQDKCMINIDRNGNTTAATIPSCLCDYESQLRKGDNLILSAFGGGYTWGATYVKWAYDGLKA